MKRGTGWQHGGAAGFTSALLSSRIAGHIFIEITQASGWHFFRNINTLFGIERKIYLKNPKKPQQNENQTNLRKFRERNTDVRKGFVSFVSP